MTMKMTFKNQLGLSLIELMVALGIGSVLMLGLTTTFQNSSNTQRDMERTGRLIENGRYAIDLLSGDLRHAGFYGYYFASLATPGALPDPCEIADVATGTPPLATNNLATAMALPIQGYNAASLTVRPVISATSCVTQGLLVNANLKPGSDIVVVRRASTDVYTGTIASDDNDKVYIQANPRTANLLLANIGSNVPTVAVDGSAPLMKYPYDPSITTPADTYEYFVHVYFVAPCSFGTGANDICTNSDDEVPTLKRLELSTNGTSTKMKIVPLVEGVEYMKVEYGIDNSPATVSLVTGFAGDGIPDTYTATPTLAQWEQVVSVRVYTLIASTQETPNFTDTKQYIFPLAAGNLTITPTDDAGTTNTDETGLKRHVYSTEVRPMNLGGRREIP